MSSLPGGGQVDGLAQDILAQETCVAHRHIASPSLVSVPLCKDVADGPLIWTCTFAALAGPSGVMMVVSHVDLDVSYVIYWMISVVRGPLSIRASRVLVGDCSNFRSWHEWGGS